MKTLPKVKELDAEYSKLLTEKKARYPDYRKAKEEMQELLRAKRNVEIFFAEEKSSTEKMKSRSGQPEHFPRYSFVTENELPGDCFFHGVKSQAKKTSEWVNSAKKGSDIEAQLHVRTHLFHKLFFGVASPGVFRATNFLMVKVIHNDRGGYCQGK